MINGQNSGPLIEVDEGDELEVEVFNKLGVDTTIHWHGEKKKSIPILSCTDGRYRSFPEGHSLHGWRAWRVAISNTTWWQFYLQILNRKPIWPLLVAFAFPRHIRRLNPRPFTGTGQPDTSSSI